VKEADCLVHDGRLLLAPEQAIGEPLELPPEVVQTTALAILPLLRCGDEAFVEFFEVLSVRVAWRGVTIEARASKRPQKFQRSAKVPSPTKN
jgi:hypothetical protein